MAFLAREFIKQKRDKKVHAPGDIDEFLKLYLSEQVPDYQMTAWLMAVFLNGLNAQESSELTKSMLESGYKFDFSHLKEARVDKHSTGGVGDKTTMILAPIVAACNIRVPMIAGRGLGHTGGTLDKLESIPGFTTKISKEKFIEGVEKNYYSIMGQTKEICPADRRIYALRDVVATIECIELICASIMSKKLAEGINGLVLDVKIGTGAFMKDMESASLLAKSLKQIGEDNHCKVHALITDMNQVLGRYVGNSAEIYECIEILKNTNEAKIEFSDCRELSLQLASHMISIGKNIELAEAYKMAEATLIDGSALNKFYELISSQGGKLDLTKPVFEEFVVANMSGFLSSFDVEKIGLAGIQLGAGRKVVSDEIDYKAAIYSHKKIGEKVDKGDRIFSLYTGDKSKYLDSMALLETCFSISSSKPEVPALIKTVLT